MTIQDVASVVQTPVISYGFEMQQCTCIDLTGAIVVGYIASSLILAQTVAWNMLSGRAPATNRLVFFEQTWKGKPMTNVAGSNLACGTNTPYGPSFRFRGR